MTTKPDYQLQRDAFGRLQLIDRDGIAHESVVPVRAFPITSPDQGMALVDPHGHELAWINSLSELPEELRQMVEAELASREFMPVISRIVSVSSFATPSTWTIVTNHGDTELVLKGEEDIRRLEGRRKLMIASEEGIHFLVPDVQALDKASRKLLERFL